jgi:hypothetical protein
LKVRNRKRKGTQGEKESGKSTKKSREDVWVHTSKVTSFELWHEKKMLAAFMPTNGCASWPEARMFGDNAC